ncbi:DUF1810 domain-containing protein [Mucilaginibacter ginkgonis]|uniref:DUF1810 domain-containing protein n=1 Tax=Mucilaginibacter ginkgonis TaxID=2682091 RepID=A0A6I4I2J3_9SPHI|nr:DUF1810 domain-containing protein [Mucilaginibacter ginkgonis]QQL49130.1 DUF1810 domain-containing protein [Mucilaginibacter ginkgonis]
MAAQYDLNGFLKAQAGDYATALAEIKAGRKRSHWMWYIFPQIAGLGHSDMAKHYAIQNLSEAEAYLHHPTLGPRLIEISKALLDLPGSNATAILGTPDDMKLHSSMTLFSLLKNTDPVFQRVLDKFFNGEKDEQTVRRVG